MPVRIEMYEKPAAKLENEPSERSSSCLYPRLARSRLSLSDAATHSSCNQAPVNRVLPLPSRRNTRSAPRGLDRRLSHAATGSFKEAARAPDIPFASSMTLRLNAGQDGPVSTDQCAVT